MARPVRLPSITTTEAMLAQRLGRRFDALRLDLGASECVLAFDPAATIRASDGDQKARAGCSLELMVRGHEIGVDMPVSCAQRLLEAVDAGTVDPETPLGALVLNLALEPVLTWFEHSFGVSGLVLSAARSPADPVAIRAALCFEARLDGEAFPVRLNLPAALWEQAVGYLETVAYTGPVRDVPVDVVIEMAALCLPARSLAQVRCGAIVLPDDPPVRKGQAQAVIGGRVRVGLAVAAMRAEVVTPPQPHAPFWQKRTVPMEDVNGVSDGTPGEIEIRLAFEIGRQTLPFSAVNRLAPGYVFDLARDPEAAVDIVANGTRIGHGEIVTIGDTIGVRVTRMFGHE
jgi:type III secretion protein Q